MSVRVRAVLTAVLVVLLPATVGAGVGAASGRGPGPAATVAADRPAAAGVTLPAGFAERAGYRPVLERFPSGQRWTRPDGGCSSPWGGTVFGFDAACRAHDLGYDLLRDASASGHPWSGAVRARIDRAFLADLRDRCAAAPAPQQVPCLGVAAVYGGAVLLNSSTEAFSAPSPESLARVALPAGAALLVLALGTLLARRGRRPALRVGAPVLLAVAGAAASWQPSLLPRSGTAQLAVTAATTLSVLVLALVVSTTWRALARHVLHLRERARWRLRLRPVVASALAAAVLVAGTAGHAGQVRRAAAEQMDTLPLGESLLAGVVGAALALGLAAVLGAAARWVGRAAERRARRRQVVEAVAHPVGAGRRHPVAHRLSAAAAVAVLAFAPVHPARSAGAADAGTTAVTGTEQPGGGLGTRLTDFLDGTPTALDLSTTTGRPARTPVRVAVPIGAGDDTARARAAVDGLRHEGGLTRGTVLVVLPTGSGWVNPAPVRATELLTGGDVATVAVQYDDRPSWQSLLTGGGPRAARQTTALLDALTAALPDHGARTRVVLYGESLGAFGGLLVARHPAVDGAVFAGVPYAASDLVGAAAGAAAGAAGRVVRVVGNDDDPVLTWAPSLATAPTRGWDGGWLPVASFWGATGDLLASLDQPAGHGHRYGAQLVPALVATVAPGATDDVQRAVAGAVADGR